MSRPAKLPRPEDVRGPLALDPLMRRRAVMAATGLSQSQLYRELRAGRFPRAVQVTENTVAWRQSDVARWIAERPEAAG